ncbi:N-6 DNA methylase [Burkholderia cenocepacia]|uniref:N-6 DNA methylase n=1 Tax=Burkholderia cenocepacia TaxID=95486 RepID=UPI0023B95C62|nr:N-6 DNA methylase [Burkholderia cenocepacia]MDF0506900.1 N-6 DNA methylase [Burkholderia cenocepacia]
MAKKSAIRMHDATANTHQAELAKMIRSLSYAKHIHDVFSDFVEVAALSISNAVDRHHYEKREARYLAVVGKYKREEVQMFPKMLATLVAAYQELFESGNRDDADLPPGGFTDVLGSLYMMFELGNDRTGQFFTPYHVSQLMARMVVGDGSDVRSKGFITLMEPACGAGGMVVAYADALLGAGINYQKAMHAICVDVDPRCVHMTYLQLSLLHIPAIVVHGNALSMEEWSHWYTPAHIVGGWRAKLARKREQERAEHEALALLSAPGGTTGQDVSPAAIAPVAPRSSSVTTEAPAGSREIDFRKLEQMALF